MKLFNAKLEVLNAVAISASEWTFDATIVDNSGQYIAYHVQLGDIVYANGFSQTTFETTVCRYKVVAIDNASGVAITFKAQWDEPNLDYADPQPGMDAIIGRVLQGGMTAITTSTNNVGDDIIGQSRNIDLAVAKLASSSQETVAPPEKFVIDDMSIINRELQLQHLIAVGSEVITMNGLPLIEGVDFDYTINGSRIVFTAYMELTEGDIFVARYRIA